MSTPSVTTYMLDITGMHCSACSGRIEKIINKISGAQINVDLLGNSATLNLDPEIKLEFILERITKIGFGAVIQTSMLDMPSEDDDALNNHLNNNHALRKPKKYSKKLADFSLYIAWMLCIPFVINMAYMLITGHDLIGGLWQLALALPVQIRLGYRFYKGSFYSLKTMNFNMDVLVALGSSSAFLLSLWLMLNQAHPHVYFEASVFILSLIHLGKWLEARAKSKTSTDLKYLIEALPKSAQILKNGQWLEIPIARILQDDLILLKHGSIIPCDGVLYLDELMVDEAALTGEANPILKRAEDCLLAGSIAHGNAQMRATSAAKDSHFAKMLQQLQSAQSTKAPIAKLADKITQIFVPIVLGLSLLTLLIHLGLNTSFEDAMINAISVLVIACPCALGLATPTAITVAMGRGARLGILFKDASVLEQTQKIDIIVFDKTGTLTETNFEIIKIIAHDKNYMEQELLQIAASLEQHSHHPLAHAFTSASASKNITLLDVINIEESLGKGLMASIGPQRFFIGSLNSEHNQNDDKSDHESDYKQADQQESQKNHHVNVGLYLQDSNEQHKPNNHNINNLNLIAEFLLHAPIKQGAHELMLALKQAHIKAIIASGDQLANVLPIATQLGITEIYAPCLPQQKLDLIKEYQAQDKIVAMIGDGVNDALALKMADLSIAMGNGAQIAIENAAITLIKGDIRQIMAAIHLSQATLKNIKQNFFFAFLYNTLLIPLAMFGFLNPIFAATAMALSSVSVVMNALRLRKVKL